MKSNVTPLDSVRKPLMEVMKERAKAQDNPVVYDAVEFDLMKLLAKLEDLERKIIVEDGKR